MTLNILSSTEAEDQSGNLMIEFKITERKTIPTERFIQGCGFVEEELEAVKDIEILSVYQDGEPALVEDWIKGAIIEGLNESG